MDPISQAVVGGIAGQNASLKKDFRIASLLAILGGMAPDLDVLIKSSVDPLLALEYHRHFTHSLLFIPLGGLLVSCFCYLIFARRFLTFFKTYLYVTAGYATHALLDACTSYGTQLFWPFSDYRVAWNNISIVDPLLTIPVLVMLIIAWVKRSHVIARIALLFLLSYLLFGALQHSRAVSMGEALALSRGHEAVEVDAKPSLANLFVWKIIYAHNGRYYVDATRVALTGQIIPGESIAMLNLERDFPWLDDSSQQAKDIERFAWFSQGYLAVSKQDPLVIVDMRYSMLPNSTDGLWGIRLDPLASSSQHVSHANVREEQSQTRPFSQLWDMIMGRYVSKSTILGQ